MEMEAKFAKARIWRGRFQNFVLRYLGLSNCLADLGGFELPNSH
jgi:hypothetical protein